MTVVSPIPHPGEIWQECDPRRARYVRVVHVGARVAIITVERLRHGDWAAALRARVMTADIGRFSGRRGGYRLHESANTVAASEPVAQESAP
jgi:hypothetical protein